MTDAARARFSSFSGSTGFSGRELATPLDTDAEQLAVIAATASMPQLVIEAGDGTAGLPTIACAIAERLARGASVLVVGGQASALDRVLDQLVALGIGEFAAPIYGDGARARVLEAMAKVVGRAFRPAPGPRGGDLAEVTIALDDHARALHAVGPLGRSIYDVLGRLTELRTAPCAPLAEPDAPGLDRFRLAERRIAAAELGRATCGVEPVAAHPWRQSSREQVTADDVARVAAALAAADASAARLLAAITELAAIVPGVVARTPEQLHALGKLARIAAVTPRPGAELLTHARVVREDDLGEQIALIRARGTGELDTPRDPATFLAIAHRQRALAAEVAETFGDEVGSLDAPHAWAQLKRWTHSVAPVRFVALRALRAQVRAVAHRSELIDDAAMVRALEAVIAERACRAALLAAQEPARRWFGSLSGDALSLDLGALDRAAAWGIELRRAFDATPIAFGEVGRLAAWRALVAQVAASLDDRGGEPLGAASEHAMFSELARAVAEWNAALRELATTSGIASALLETGSDHLRTLRERVAQLAPAVATLPAWAEFHRARRLAREAGVGLAVAAAERGDLAGAELADAWERATLLSWLAGELAAFPVLARFAGADHHARVAQFGQRDRALIAQARTDLIAQLAERVPRSSGPDVDPRITAIARRQVADHRALRDILTELGELLPRVAPCVLTTPSAALEHLDPALPRFDLVIVLDAARLAHTDAAPLCERGEHVALLGDPDAAPAGLAELSALAYASAGGWPQLALTMRYGDTAIATADDAEPTSPITSAIARALAERGWRVHHRVVVGPIAVDLAVSDPDDPSRIVLAIEDDGGAYRDAHSARDRDRLRAQVLTGLGVREHRIWALDWWREPDRELQRAHGAIVAALAASRPRRTTSPTLRAPRDTSRPRAQGSQPIVSTAAVAVAVSTPASGTPLLADGSGPQGSPQPIDAGKTIPNKLARGAIAIGPYVAAAVPAGRRTPDDMFSPRHAGELGKLIETVLAAEAPIHIELLARRVSAYFGIGRTTPEVIAHVRAMVDGRGRWGDEGDIVWSAAQDPAAVPAVRVAGTGGARRAIDEVPLCELAAAARIVVERAAGLGAADLIRDCARLLGFARMDDQIGARVALGIQLASSRTLIEITDGRARLPA